MFNCVSIVGRPNVGKSTLFNRLTETNDAIIDEKSGVTRDRHYGKVLWNGREFYLIDTGGYITNSDDIFEKEILKQIKYAIDESDIIIFLVDVKDGITPLDIDVAEYVRKSGKKILLAVNKVDNAKIMMESLQFHKLGIDEIFPISAINGSGTGELLDHIINLLPNKKEDNTVDLPRIAVVGKPNTGKSSLINTLLGEERNIVTPISGTTRDSIYTHFNKYGFNFYIVDTAGIRKKNKILEDIEFYSILRAIRAIENSDVCILMIDAKEGITKQDLNIFGLIRRNNKGIVMVVNKWDLIEKTDSNITKKYTDQIKNQIAPFSDIPIIFTSVINKLRIHKVLETAIKVYERRIQKIPTHKLNELLLPIINETPPPIYKGKKVSIKYITQLPTYYPSFAFFCNLPQYVKPEYKRYIENIIRKTFDFTGVPIEIFLRQK